MHVNPYLAAILQYEGSAIYSTEHQWKCWYYLSLLISVGLPYPGLHGCLPKANMGADLWLQECLALGKQGQSYVDPACIVGLPYPGLHGCLPMANTGANLWLQGCLTLGKQGWSYHAGHVVADVLGIRCISTTAQCIWTKWPSASGPQLVTSCIREEQPQTAIK